MDVDDRVPLLLGHVGEHPVAQDAGVVDDDVQIAERLDRGVDEALGSLPAADTVAVGDGLAAHPLDLVDDLLGRRQVAAAAVDRPAEIVDDDLGTVLGKAERVLATDAAARSGDDRDATFAQSTHPGSSCRAGSPQGVDRGSGGTERIVGSRPAPAEGVRM